MSNEPTVTVLDGYDRSQWKPGPWHDEPDRIAWTDETTGRPCLMLRNRMGAWCGYVAVDPGHPLHGKGYDDPDVTVHGGLTYADACYGEPGEGICHTPEPGQPDDVWWFGFDTAHCGDVCPHVHLPSFGRDETYRDVEYVRAEVLSLAAQLVAS